MELHEIIRGIESQIEKALWDMELHDKLKEALDVYLNAEARLEKLGITSGHSAYPQQQRVLSYCLMRQGNILRQMGQMEQALSLGEREIAAARASGDSLMLARSLMSNGTNLIVTGNLSKGLDLIEKARELFESGVGTDYQQGLGWYWILQADLANAGLIKKDSAVVIESSNHALEILKPIENWPGVARAYAARSVAHRKLGDEAQADRDRTQQVYYENMVKSNEDSAG
jgi:tetratricopeptide (TPR) repeat protein